ncbi:MAG: hypothetical protein RI906_1291, partial [Pseudomonadota bacterium]
RRWVCVLPVVASSSASADRLSSPKKPPGMAAFFMVRPAWAHTCGCKSRCELVTVSKVKRNRVRATERGEEAWSVNREPMNKNRIEGELPEARRDVFGFMRPNAVTKSPRSKPFPIPVVTT